MVFTLALLLYVIVQFIAFLFVLVGTPIDMFRPLNGSRFGNTLCITLWGSKNECYSSRIDVSLEQLWVGCPDRRSLFKTAQVFAIISICVYGIAAVLGFIALCCCSCLHWVCLALNLTGAITLCVVWASMVVVYEKDDNRRTRQSRGSVYGIGFAMLVIGWCLDIINIALLLLP
ncbi:amastin-like protein [Leishmania guyanensis]